MHAPYEDYMNNISFTMFPNGQLPILFTKVKLFMDSLNRRNRNQPPAGNIWWAVGEVPLKVSLSI